MAKKKKTQLKPVARPIATASVPKKVVPAETATDEVASDEVVVDADAADGAGASGGNAPDVEPESEEVKALKAEEKELQNLVEKLQDKTEKEINRTIKALEYERRMSKTLPSLNLDPVLRTRILKLYLEEETEADSSGLPPIDDPLEKILVRVGITYGVLMRSGFTEDRVLECLKLSQSFELDEAFDWLCLHCDEEELELDKEKEIPEEPKSPVLPQTPRTPQAFQTPSALSVTAPMTPSPLSRQESVTSSIAAVLDAANTPTTPTPQDLKSRVLTAYQKSQTDDSDTRSISTSTSTSDMLDLDPNAEFARLKLKIFQRGLEKGTSSPEFAKLNAADEARLAELRKHYFFKEKDAELMFRHLKTSAIAAAKEARLRDLDSPAPSSSVSSNLSALGASPSKKGSRKDRARPPSLATPSRSTQGSPKKPAINVSNDSGTDESEGAGGMFGNLLDEMPASETIVGSNGANTLIRIRDMSLPKQWGGRTPKLLLMEVARKLDRYSALTYSVINAGSSRAVRCALSIRWGAAGRQKQLPEEWVMNEDGCHDQGQAEQFVATLALHALSFLPVPGFAASVTSGGAGSSGAAQSHFRVLPPIYRDLWDELEAKRKDSEDSANRGIWRRLRDIVEPRVGAISKSVKSVKAPVVVDDTPEHWESRAAASDQQVIDNFRARQMTRAYQEMFVHRMNLPIAPFRNEIVTILDNNQVMVLSGETGCGKSTQVPAFILEEQLSRGLPCKIYCTEPRRISAISLAQRVSQELGDAPGAVGTNASLVGYSIRLESNTSRNTRLAYVTNGIALRMLESGSGTNGKDTAFDEITHLIVDEVHERSIESDFLLIILKSLLEQRPNLKVVLMSATLDAEKISDYFGGCPILRVPGRTFPVDVRFMEDAVELTRWSVQEGSIYAKRLNDPFHKNKQALEWNEETALNEDDEETSDGPSPSKLEPRYSQSTVSTVNLFDERTIPYDLIVRLMEVICYQNEQYIPFSAAILVFMPGMNEIRRLHEMLTEHEVFGGDAFQIHPLHSTISTENQSLVFELPPVGVRKIVIATNIAETGVTIPDITCVIDTGKHREMRFDEKRQISRLVETYIARSNAAQRRGRAGRVQSGLCFHLFTKFRHDNLIAEHPLPEMLRLSLSDLALRTKILKVKLGGTIEEVLSKALDPPAATNVQRAVAALVEVKALTASEDITPMGRLLSKLPTDVHLGKFLLTAAVFKCLDPALTIAATLNSKSPFLVPFGHEQEAERAKNSFKVEGSDFLTLHAAFSSWRRACASPGNIRVFCRKNFLSHQNLQQIEELRQQFLGYLIDSSFIRVDKAFERELSRTRFGRGKVRFVAVPPQFDQNAGQESILNAALVAGLYPKVLTIEPGSGQLRTLSNNQPTSFHPSSVNFHRRAKDFGVNHLSYFTLMHSKKLYVWESGPVDDLAMFLLCGDADFKLSGNSAFLDRKIKFSAVPKSNMAIKILRTRLATVLSAQMRGKPLSAAQVQWSELALLVLSRVPVELDGEDEAVVVRQPPSVDLKF
ncbi:P-loop containing nucleoside triphosphate hydrolase protein [Clavulina sp. PMI_390]|nr:P-loop containing nucleoside triphosphate hydrolase protein [Clavulina sp. PMI_390]